MKNHKLFIFFYLICFAISINGNNWRPLKILYVVGPFPKLSETFVLDQITGLIDRGHNVQIYANNKLSEKKVHKIISEYNLIKRVHYQKIPHDINTYDVIICSFGTYADKFISYKLKHKIPAKIVTLFRGYDLSRVIQSKSKPYRNLINYGDLFLPVCQYYRDRLLKIGFPNQKIVVHYDCTDTDKFAFKKRNFLKNETINIISIGRIIEKKGFEYVIEAIEKLSHIVPNIKLTILGDGPLKNKLIEYTKKLKISSIVTFLESGNQDEVIKQLDVSDIFVLAAIKARDGDEDTMPMVLKEAMSLGIPCIASDQGGIPELITDGQSGFIFKAGNANMLVKKLITLLESNESKWQSIVHNARNTMEKKFSLSIANDKLENLLLILTNQS